MTESKLPDPEAVAARAEELRRSRFHSRNRALLADRVRNIKQGKAHVLELGSGHLDFTLDYLQQASGELVATDLEQLFPKGTPLPAGVSFQLEDALDLSFSDDSFDCVIALEVIEHVADEDKFVTEGLRVLRPGGKLIFTTPNRLRLTALARYLIGRPIRFPHTYAVDPVLGEIRHLREFSYGDLTELVRRHQSLIANADIEGIALGVPAWQLILLRSGPLHRLAFNWHVTLEKRAPDRG
jgi:ubiquinone/menaquinone biosynthesis C-methylase UbiE